MKAPLLRRLERAEGRLARLPAEIMQDATRWLTFAEICRGQAALRAYGGDVAKALEDGDLTMTALVAVAELRRQGVQVGELFHHVEARPPAESLSDSEAMDEVRRLCRERRDVETMRADLLREAGRHARQGRC